MSATFLPAAVASLASLLCLPGQPPGPPPAAPPDRTVSGVVLAAGDAPVAGATVLLCDAASGLPLLRGTWAPFTDDPDLTEHAMNPASGEESPFAAAATDANGRFTFSGLPAGTYRVVAQSWGRSERFRAGAPAADGEGPFLHPLTVNGDIVHLRGAASGLVVSDDRPETSVILRPLGDGVLRVDAQAANDETLLVISTAPVGADPVLGFAGWTGPFVQNMIGFNRMPAGVTRIEGLPSGDGASVHVALFSADNNPGWGAASVRMPPGPAREVVVPFVAAWSDGVHSPPPEIAAVVDELRAAGVTERGAVFRLVAESGLRPPRDPGRMGGGFMAWMGENRAAPVRLPSGREAPLADVAAAAGYMAIADSLERSGRKPNPHREAVVRPLSEDR